MKRPVSVWIVQALFALVILVITSSLVSWGKFGYEIFSSGNIPEDFSLDLLKFAVEFGVAAFLISAFMAMAKQDHRARMKGMVGLVLVFALWILTEIIPHKARYTYDNNDQRLGATVAGILWVVGMVILFWRLGFSSRVRLFFNIPTKSNDPK